MSDTILESNGDKTLFAIYLLILSPKEQVSKLVKIAKLAIETYYLLHTPLLLAPPPTYVHTVIPKVMAITNIWLHASKLFYFLKILSELEIIVTI